MVLFTIHWFTLNHLKRSKENRKEVLRSLARQLTVLAVTSNEGDDKDSKIQPYSCHSYILPLSKGLLEVMMLQQSLAKM